MRFLSGVKVNVLLGEGWQEFGNHWRVFPWRWTKIPIMGTIEFSHFRIYFSINYLSIGMGYPILTHSRISWVPIFVSWCSNAADSTNSFICFGVASCSHRQELVDRCGARPRWTTWTGHELLWIWTGKGFFWFTLSCMMVMVIMMIWWW